MKNKQPRRRQAPRTRKGGPSRPARRNHTVFRQVCNLIPEHKIPVLAREYKIDARGFSETSHVFALVYGHISRALSLNEICDALSVHAPEVMRIRGATPPKRNTFSNANRTRDPAVAENLYWQMLTHLQATCPGFTQYGKHAGFIFRLKREIFAMDSTTLQLTLASIDWARHRRRKAAAKCHMRLNIGTFLPTFTVVEDAAHHDSVRAGVLCAGMVTGDVLLADRAYVDLPFLASLEARGIFFVLRPKRKMLFTTIKKLSCKGKILRDELVRPAGVKTAKSYPCILRLVTALVEVDGVEREMTFITNNTVWSARTIAELYRARWTIELFFKELKQTLQLRDFVGINEKAVKWQVWTGLLTHLLLRFLRHVSRWGRSFSRCVGIVRSALWVKTDLAELLVCYGTANGPHRPVLCAKEPFLPGFEAFSSSLMGQHG
ncbi:MAG: IS4 family transposase [Planctomycetota bacterium]|nr:IS4 family transposase [Planctomycetota bacterium]